MKNSNGKFSRDQWNIFQCLSQQEVRQLCICDISFTALTGILYLRKGNITDHQYRIPAKLLLQSMEQSLLLSQN
jgi:hypothetical protein